MSYRPIVVIDTTRTLKAHFDHLQHGQECEIVGPVPLCRHLRLSLNVDTQSYESSMDDMVCRLRTVSTGQPHPLLDYIVFRDLL